MNDEPLSLTLADDVLAELAREAARRNEAAADRRQRTGGVQIFRTTAADVAADVLEQWAKSRRGSAEAVIQPNGDMTATDMKGTP